MVQRKTESCSLTQTTFVLERMASEGAQVTAAGHSGHGVHSTRAGAHSGAGGHPRAGSVSPPPGFTQRWACARSVESVSSGLRREQDHVSGMGLSSESGGSGEVAQPVAARGPSRPEQARGRVQDRLVWHHLRPSRKSLWRSRMERRQEEFLRKRKAVSPEMDGVCFNCYREGHMKWECTNPMLCLRCGLEGHAAKDCELPRSPSSEDELRRLALAKRARRSPPVPVGLGQCGPRLGLRLDWPGPSRSPPPPQQLTQVADPRTSGHR
jgi:hypothetical protein